MKEYRDTGIQGDRDKGIQDTGIPGYRERGIRDTGIRGYGDNGIQGYVFFVRLLCLALLCLTFCFS